jgi:hypothetical protein
LGLSLIGLAFLLFWSDARAQSNLDTEFMRRFAFSLGAEFGRLIAQKSLARDPTNDAIRSSEYWIITKAKLVGLPLALRPGRRDGEDRNVITEEYRRASFRLADHLDSRFGTAIRSAYALGYDLQVVAAASASNLEPKPAVVARHKQLAARAQIDARTFASLYDQVLKTTDFDSALTAAYAAELATLREMDQRLIDSSAYRRLRANVFQAAFRLSTGALAARVNRELADREFETAQIYSNSGQLVINGFSAPMLELARIPVEGTDAAKRDATILHYLLNEQSWITTIGEVYGWPVANLGDAGIKMGISFILYGQDSMGAGVRQSICRAFRSSGTPEAVWRQLADNRVNYELYKKRLIDTQQRVVGFLESTQVSTPLPTVESNQTDHCPRL